MKGLGLTGLVMITIIGMTILLLILMSSVGVTPPYYQSLPETQYIDLISTYFQLTENAERAITLGTEDFFDTAREYPLEWNDTWSTDNFETAVEDKFAEKLGKMALSYLNSVSHPQGTVTSNASSNFTTSSSELSYNPDTSELNWNYSYDLSLYIPLFGRGKKLHSIDTTRKLSTTYDFLDLNDVYDCGSDFFNSKLPNINYRFNDEKDGVEIERELKNLFYEKLSSTTCKNRFDLEGESEIDFEIEVFCSSKCDCKTIKGANITMIFRNKKSEASLAFSKEFNNFGCGELSVGCSNGFDCCGEDTCERDCVNGVCSTCWSGSAGDPCSPKGSTTPVGSNEYKCYETDSGKYKCLESYSNAFYKFGGETYYFNNPTKPLEVNCGDSKEKYLTIKVPTSYKLIYGGVEIDMSTPEIDLCNDDKIPRKDGKLDVYVSSDYGETTYYYKIDEVRVRFNLSKYITALNGKMAEESYEGCPSNEELKDYYKDDIVSYLNDQGPFDSTGYSIDVSAETENIHCNENYAIIKVKFLESDSDVAITLHYPIRLKTNV